MWTWNDGTELYHHGILGQKWGRRNGPPYPLDAKRHSASEKKAGWRKSLKNKWDGLSDSEKKAAKVGAIIVGSAIALYGAYKVSEFINTYEPVSMRSIGIKEDLIYNGVKVTSDLESYKQVKLNPKEYVKVISEIMTHISRNQRENDDIIIHRVGNYIYTAINNKDGTFIIVDKARITGT